MNRHHHPPEDQRIETHQRTTPNPDMLVLVPTYLHYRLSSQEGILPGPDRGMPFLSTASVPVTQRKCERRGGYFSFEHIPNYICTLFLSYRSSDIYHSKPRVFVSEL